MRTNRYMLVVLSLVLAIAAACSKSNQSSSQTSTQPPGATAPTATAAQQSAPAAQQSAASAPSAVASNPPTSSPAPASANPAPPASQPAPAAPAQTAQVEPPPPPPKPASFALPVNMPISVRTTSTLSTKTNKTGEPFNGSLASPIVIHGVTIARTGAPVDGVIVDSDPGGRVKGRATLTVSVQRVRSVDGQEIALSTGSYQAEAKSTKKKDAAKVGIGAGLGALIGGIAGGGKGAGIGAAVGGGAGGGAVIATRGDPAVIPSETILSFRLAAPAGITERRPGSLRHIPASEPTEPQ
jgi:hypothetical protein